MSAEISGVDRRRVEPVVVSRRKVNYHVVQLVAAVTHGFQQAKHRWIRFIFSDLIPSGARIFFVTNNSGHEFIKTVRPALNAVNSAVF